MSLPKQLNLGSNKPLGAQGMPSINRYRADNSSYNNKDTIRIEIPTGRNGQYAFPNDCFLEGRLKINASCGATATDVYLDQSILSIFNRVRVLHGSTVLEDTLHVNKLWSAIMDVQMNESERRSSTINYLISDTTAANNGNQYNAGTMGLKVMSMAVNAVAADSTIYDFCIVLPSAVLGSLAQKALPLGLMKSSSLYLELELADVNIPFVTVAAGTATINSFTVQDIYYNMKTVTLPSDINSALVDTLGNHVELPAVAYKADVKALAAGSTSFSDKFPFNFSSVKSFYFWHQNSSSASSTLTKRSVTARTKASLNDFFLNINGVAYPQQSISNLSRVYQELVRSFDGLIDTNFGGILSYQTYGNNDCTTATDVFTAVPSTINEKRFIAGVDLDRFNHSSDVLLSGTSTIGQILSLVCNYSAATAEAVNLYGAVMYDVIFVLEDGMLSPRF